MCGIFGAIQLSGKFSDSNYRQFVQLTDLVSYRGPDASGYLALDSFGKNSDSSSFNIFLGHRRLSIIDLSSSGNQPLKDENIYIVFNGEIFNYVELKSELIGKGYSFSTNTDTEVILKTYREYGADGFAQFNGMWAFILVDLKKNKIIVSRDRFSIKPLYYFQDNDIFYFASEIKQLIPLLKTKDINEGALYAYLKQSLVDYNNETFLKKIFKIKPKTNFVIDLNTGKTEEKKYWDYDFHEVNNEKEAIENFRELFFDSVKIRLRSDVKIGSLLSGGLDSSAITMVANEITKGNFESFSVVSNEKKYSEEFFIDALIKEKQLTNKKLFFDTDMILDNLDKVVYHQDEPFLSFSVVAQQLIFQKIKNETDIMVVLSGQGGDEAMMGYSKYYYFNLINLLKQGKIIEFSKQVFLSLFYRTTLWNFDFGVAKRYIPFVAKKNIDYLRTERKLENIWQYKNMADRQSLDIDCFSVPALARYEDRNSMAYGLEVRHPFLDHRLINFLLGLRADYKLKNGWTKYILRKSMNELPKQIQWRRDKQGFVTPEAKWLTQELKPTVINSFEKSILHEMGIIDKNKFLHTYKSFINGNKQIHFTDITRTLIAELWAKRFFQSEK